MTFDQDHASYQENMYKDMLTGPVLKEWSDCFLSGQRGDPYSVPLSAPTDWWQDAQADDIFIVAGKDEVFRDGIVEFAKKVQVS